MQPPAQWLCLKRASCVHPGGEGPHRNQQALLGCRTEPLERAPAAMHSRFGTEGLRGYAFCRILNFLARPFELCTGPQSYDFLVSLDIQEHQFARHHLHLGGAHSINRELQAIVSIFLVAGSAGLIVHYTDSISFDAVQPVYSSDDLELA